MMEGKVRNRVFVYNAYHRDAQEIMIPNNEPPAIVVPPSGSFTTPAPPRGAFIPQNPLYRQVLGRIY